MDERFPGPLMIFQSCLELSCELEWSRMVPDDPSYSLGLLPKVFRIIIRGDSDLETTDLSSEEQLRKIVCILGWMLRMGSIIIIIINNIMLRRFRIQHRS